jgi:Domain of unknown function (DUF4249)
MKLVAKTSVFFYILLLFSLSCRKSYNPPAIKANNHFLAVDGLIQTGNNATSTFIINRSLNLTDTIPNIPELNAQVFIQASDGNSYTLHDTAGNGIYVSSPLNLDTTRQYQLSITSSDGTKYLSDFVSAKPAPPVDSVTWELVNDPITLSQSVNVYVNSHDATNNTRYYRWDYLETFKNVSVFDTPWGEADGLIYPLPVGYSTSNCWSTSLSGNIVLGTSITLSQDVISHLQVANYSQNDPKMDIGNSILVRQYPLTLDAYNYWLTVQKNSQSLGGLFDLQPSQITGNLHCITNPKNPALGYISASFIQEKRIYISNKSLPGWKSNPIYSCPTNAVLQDQLNLLIYNYPDTAYGPYHFEGDLITYLIVAPKSCMDCRYQGGVNIKPPFWPPYD